MTQIEYFLHLSESGHKHCYYILVPSAGRQCGGLPVPGPTRRRAGVVERLPGCLREVARDLRGARPHPQVAADAAPPLLDCVIVRIQVVAAHPASFLAQHSKEHTSNLDLQQD